MQTNQQIKETRPHSQQVAVALGDRSYDIHIGAGLFNEPSLWLSHCKGKKVAIVSNTTVAPLYSAALSAQLKAAGKTVIEVVLPDGEAYKDWSCIAQIMDALLQNQCGRSTTLIALGGGVIGDMTGFAASIYMRGIPFIQIPTTLLSQVDSSVGGQTGINHPLGKNMIGSFYQPQVVVIDTNTLNTLPDRELSAGLAEVLKHGLIRDANYLDWTVRNMSAIRAREPAALIEVVKRSVEIKAEVVGQDEREAGLRAILNFGHTFGHAIEAGMGYGNWLHGEAVGAGMVLASATSLALGYLTAEAHAANTAAIAAAGLPITPPDLGVAQYQQLMAVDKKAGDSGLQFILLKAIGEAVIQTVPDEILQSVLQTTVAQKAQ